MKNTFILIIFAFATNFYAQDPKVSKKSFTNPLTTEKWLKDATTFTLESPEAREERRQTRLNRRIINNSSNTRKKNRFERRLKRDWTHNSLNGLRIVFEPQVGTLFQRGINKIETPNLTALGKLGFETNVYKGFCAVQALVIYPSRVQYDDKSEYRVNGYTVDSLGWVGVDVGFSLGLSFFDGILAVGYGGLFFDKRDFKNTDKQLVYQNNFVYLNVQILSAIKAVLKND